MNYRNIFIALATISGGISASAQAAESATVAFLMPDQAPPRVMSSMISPVSKRK